MIMLLNCLLNPLTPLILKSTIIFCLYKFNLALKGTGQLNVHVSSEENDQTETFEVAELQVEIL